MPPFCYSTWRLSTRDSNLDVEMAHAYEAYQYSAEALQQLHTDEYTAFAQIAGDSGSRSLHFVATLEPPACEHLCNRLDLRELFQGLAWPWQFDLPSTPDVFVLQARLDGGEWYDKTDCIWVH